MEAEIAMELAYVLGAICIVYKLAFLIRQTAFLHAGLVALFRIAGGILGTVVIVQAIRVFETGARVEPLELAAQGAWCVILASAIVLIGRRRKAW